jgi:hypothetical protein
VYEKAVKKIETIAETKKSNTTPIEKLRDIYFLNKIDAKASILIQIKKIINPNLNGVENKKPVTISGSDETGQILIKC